MTVEERKPLDKRLVAACRGMLHDGKALRIVGLYERAPGFARFKGALGTEFPGLTDEARKAITKELYPDGGKSASTKTSKTTKGGKK